MVHCNIIISLFLSNCMFQLQNDKLCVCIQPQVHTYTCTHTHTHRYTFIISQVFHILSQKEIQFQIMLIEPEHIYKESIKYH